MTVLQSSVRRLRQLLSAIRPASVTFSPNLGIKRNHSKIYNPEQSDGPPPISGVSDTHRSTLFSSLANFQAKLGSTDSGISSDTVMVDGEKIHYEITGHGKQVILLLPGALGSTRTDFGPQLDHLNKDLFSIVAWDPPGYGKSYPPERVWREKFLHHDAHLAANLMQLLDVKSYSCLGWSDGGITAIILAANNPQHVRKLVVWGANSYITEQESSGYDMLRDIDSWSPRMRQPFIKLYGEDYFRKAWAGWVDNFVSRYYTECGGDICKEETRNVTCPTLIVHGAKDPMVPQFHADDLQDNIKNSRLDVWPEGKHNLHLRFYKEFNSLVEQFLVEV